MNYGRIREALKSKQKELSKMSGKDRTAYENKLIQDAEQEQAPVVESKKEEVKEVKTQKAK